MMPFVDIKVIEGVFTHGEKREAVERVTDALLETWGEGMRKSTHIVITETSSGEGAIGGRAMSADDIKKERQSSS